MTGRAFAGPPGAYARQPRVFETILRAGVEAFLYERGFGLAGESWNPLGRQRAGKHRLLARTGWKATERE